MKLPMCIRRGNLHKLIDDVNEWKDREDEGCWSELDATESELMAKFKPPAGYEQINYDYTTDFSMNAPPEECIQDVGSFNMKRTMVEQAADVSPMFKMVKKIVELKKKRKRESDSEEV